MMPCMLRVAPGFPLYKAKIPIVVSIIAPTVVFVIFSLKNIAIIIATMIGYIKRIVQAIPASIYLKASKRVRDDNEKKIARINSGRNSFSEILREIFLIKVNHSP